MSVTAATMPDSPGLIIFGKILAMAVVMFCGWFIRRVRRVTDDMVSRLAIAIIDIFFPALAVSQLIRFITWESLQGEAALMGLGGLLFVVGSIAAWLFARLMPAASRKTVVFLMATPNWIFMPLPVAEALYGVEGVKVVLMINVPMQVWLWTAGVGWLHGGLRGEHPVSYLLRNRGLQATVLGIGGALLLPSDAALAAHGVTGRTAMFLGHQLLDGLALLGSLTVPLSLLVTGAQLGRARDTSEPSAGHGILAWVVAGRLLAVPAVCAGVILLLRACGWHMEPVVAGTAMLISAMPVAVSCGSFTDRYGGDTDLASRGIFFSTAFSCLTIVLWSALGLI